MGNGCSSTKTNENAYTKDRNNNQDRDSQLKQSKSYLTAINKDVNNNLIDNVHKNGIDGDIESKSKLMYRNIARDESLHFKFMQRILSNTKLNDIYTLLQVFRYHVSAEREKSMLCLSPNQQSLNQRHVRSFNPNAMIFNQVQLSQSNSNSKLVTTNTNVSNEIFYKRLAITKYSLFKVFSSIHTRYTRYLLNDIFTHRRDQNRILNKHQLSDTNNNSDMDKFFEKKSKKGEEEEVDIVLIPQENLLRAFQVTSYESNEHSDTLSNIEVLFQDFLYTISMCHSGTIEETILILFLLFADKNDHNNSSSLDIQHTTTASVGTGNLASSGSSYLNLFNKDTNNSKSRFQCLSYIDKLAITENAIDKMYLFIYLQLYRHQEAFRCMQYSSKHAGDMYMKMQCSWIGDIHRMNSNPKSPGIESLITLETIPGSEDDTLVDKILKRIEKIKYKNATMINNVTNVNDKPVLSFTEFRSKLKKALTLKNTNDLVSDIHGLTATTDSLKQYTVSDGTNPATPLAAVIEDEDVSLSQSEVHLAMRAFASDALPCDTQVYDFWQSYFKTSLEFANLCKNVNYLTVENLTTIHAEPAEFDMVLLDANWFKSWCNYSNIIPEFSNENETLQHLVRNFTLGSKLQPSDAINTQLSCPVLHNILLIEQIPIYNGICECYHFKEIVINEVEKAAKASLYSSKQQSIPSTTSRRKAASTPTSSTVKKNTTFPLVYVLLPLELGLMLYQRYDIDANNISVHNYIRRLRFGNTSVPIAPPTAALTTTTTRPFTDILVDFTSNTMNSMFYKGGGVGNQTAVASNTSSAKSFDTISNNSNSSINIIDLPVDEMLKLGPTAVQFVKNFNCCNYSILDINPLQLPVYWCSRVGLATLAPVEMISLPQRNLNGVETIVNMGDVVSATLTAMHLCSTENIRNALQDYRLWGLFLDDVTVASTTTSSSCAVHGTIAHTKVSKGSSDKYSQSSSAWKQTSNRDFDLHSCDTISHTKDTVWKLLTLNQRDYDRHISVLFSEKDINHNCIGFMIESACVDDISTVVPSDNKNNNNNNVKNKWPTTYILERQKLRNMMLDANKGSSRPNTANTEEPICPYKINEPVDVLDNANCWVSGTVALIDRLQSIDLTRSFLMVTVRVSLNQHSNISKVNPTPVSAIKTTNKQTHQLIQLLYNTTRVLKHGAITELHVQSLECLGALKIAKILKRLYDEYEDRVCSGYNDSLLDSEQQQQHLKREKQADITYTVTALESSISGDVSASSSMDYLTTRTVPGSGVPRTSLRVTPVVENPTDPPYGSNNTPQDLFHSTDKDSYYSDTSTVSSPNKISHNTPSVSTTTAIGKEIISIFKIFEMDAIDCTFLYETIHTSYASSSCPLVLKLLYLLILTEIRLFTIDRHQHHDHCRRVLIDRNIYTQESDFVHLIIYLHTVNHSTDPRIAWKTYVIEADRIVAQHRLEQQQQQQQQLLPNKSTSTLSRMSNYLIGSSASSNNNNSSNVNLNSPHPLSVTATTIAHTKIHLKASTNVTAVLPVVDSTTEAPPTTEFQQQQYENKTATPLLPHQSLIHNNTATVPALPITAMVGVTGLNNLGNTCFLSSALQCLLHCKPFISYFLTQQYKTHLYGAKSPLGSMNGRVTQEFANFISLVYNLDQGVAPTTYTIATPKVTHNTIALPMIGGNTTATTTTNTTDSSKVSHINSSSGGQPNGSSASGLQHQIEDIKSMSPTLLLKLFQAHKSQFSGADQQDAQEFLCELLDTLHEDLKRPFHRLSPPSDSEKITKPLAANSIDQDQNKTKQDNTKTGSEKNITEQGNRHWDKYEENNKSIITDLFQGQMCSKIICKQCNSSSATFQPFTTLSMPIPRNRGLPIEGGRGSELVTVIFTIYRKLPRLSKLLQIKLLNQQQQSNDNLSYTDETLLPMSELLQLYLINKEPVKVAVKLPRYGSATIETALLTAVDTYNTNLSQTYHEFCHTQPGPHTQPGSHTQPGLSPGQTGNNNNSNGMSSSVLAPYLAPLSASHLILMDLTDSSSSSNQGDISTSSSAADQLEKPRPRFGKFLDRKEPLSSLITGTGESSILPNEYSLVLQERNKDVDFISKLPTWRLSTNYKEHLNIESDNYNKSNTSNKKTTSSSNKSTSSPQKQQGQQERSSDNDSIETMLRYAKLSYLEYFEYKYNGLLYNDDPGFEGKLLADLDHTYDPHSYPNYQSASGAHSLSSTEILKNNLKTPKSNSNSNNIDLSYENKKEWPRRISAFQIGDRVDAVDYKGSWYGGSVMDIIVLTEAEIKSNNLIRYSRDFIRNDVQLHKKGNSNNNNNSNNSNTNSSKNQQNLKILMTPGVHVRVHFDGFSPNWDEWFGQMDLDLGLIRPIYSNSSRKLKLHDIAIVHRRITIQPQLPQLQQAKSSDPLSFSFSSYQSSTAVNTVGGLSSNSSMKIQPVASTVGVEILSYPSYLQCESYRTIAHFYTHIHEQMLRYIQTIDQLKEVIERPIGDDSNPFSIRMCSFTNLLSPPQFDQHMKRDSSANSLLSDNVAGGVGVGVNGISIKSEQSDISTRFYGHKNWEGSILSYDTVRPVCNIYHNKLAICVDWLCYSSSLDTTTNTNSNIDNGIGNIYTATTINKYLEAFDLYREDLSYKKYLAERERLVLEQEKEKKQYQDAEQKAANVSSYQYDTRNGLTIEHILSAFVGVEDIDEYFCDHCKKPTNSTLHSSIHKLPDVLVLHLQRLTYSGKIRTLVKFPLQSLNMQHYTTEHFAKLASSNSIECTLDDPSEVEQAGIASDCLNHNSNINNNSYDLIGVVNHHGGMHGGHYTAFSKCELLPLPAYKHSSCNSSSSTIAETISYQSLLEHHPALRNHLNYNNTNGNQGTTKRSDNTDMLELSLNEFIGQNDLQANIQPESIDKILTSYHPSEINYSCNTAAAASSNYSDVCLASQNPNGSIASQWVRFDDEFAVKFNEKDIDIRTSIVTEGAFLLFYQRKQLSAANIINYL